MSMVPTRRRFLAGFSALSAVAGGTALTIAAKADPVADAELLALDGEIVAALARYDACCEAKAKCVEFFRAIEPVIPESLIIRVTLDYLATEWPPSIEGRPCPKAVSNRIRIPARYDLDHRVKQTDGRTTIGRYYRRLKRQSDAFHAAHHDARRQAGLPEAEERRYYAGRELQMLCERASDIRATSQPGLVVKGRAGLAKHRVSFAESGLYLDPSHRKLLENLVSLGVAKAA